jgi:ComF family protein
MPVPSSIFDSGRLASRGVRAFLRAAVDFVYPPVCPFCGREHGDAEPAGPGSALCGPCRARLAPIIEHACRRCAAPVGPHLDTSDGCIHCRDDRFAFETVVRLGVYDGPLRAACLRMKQPDGQVLAAAVAGLLWEREREALQRAEVDLVVPVPHHWTQRLSREHNPAATLARTLGRRLHAAVEPHILGKSRRTPAQASLPPSERRRNLRDAFRVGGASALSGRTVLLVDDVLTTGTTAHEISKVLLRAGAARVVVAVLARGLGQSS